MNATRRTDDGGLTRTVRTDQTENLPGPDVKAHARHRACVIVILVQVFDPDECVICRRIFRMHGAYLFKGVHTDFSTIEVIIPPRKRKINILVGEWASVACPDPLDCLIECVTGRTVQI